MSDAKKYYYLKLKDNFYDSEEMILLQNMPDGYLYSDILMKLYLRSLKTEGKLMFKEVIPYTPTVLAQVVRHQVGTVEKALNIFQDLGLVEVLDNGAIYMLDIQNFIGKSSSEADRKRDYRAKIKGEKMLLGQMSSQTSDNSPPEIEIELEIEKDNIKSGDKPPQKKPTYSKQYKEIIDYLNNRLGTQYKYKSVQTQKLIKSRLEEGFTVADFKTVIDKKYIEWYKDEKMRQYLRPVTLFGTKFEGYLNQDIKIEEEKPKQKVVIEYDSDLGQFVEKVVDGE